MFGVVSCRLNDTLANSYSNKEELARMFHKQMWSCGSRLRFIFLIIFYFIFLTNQTESALSAHCTETLGVTKQMSIF